MVPGGGPRSYRSAPRRASALPEVVSANPLILPSSPELPGRPALRAVPEPSVLVVVPTFNEVDNVEPLSRGVLKALPRGELVFVDDNSPDGTASRIAELSRSDPRIGLLSRRAKLGLGTAYLAGFSRGLAGGYDVVVTMDGDLSHDPAYLPELVAATSRSDVVIGSRYVPGGGVRNWSVHRRLLSRCANAYARTLLEVPVRDCTSGFRAYRAQVLRSLPLGSIRSSGYSFLEEMLFLADRGGFRLGEIPILFIDRLGGHSKISSAEIFLAVYHVLRLRLTPAPPAATPEVSGGLPG